MRYILAISLLFLSACKSTEEEVEDACQGDAQFSTLNGNWRLDYAGSQGGLPHVIRLRFRPSSEEVKVEYTCGNGYGDVAPSIKRESGYGDDGDGGLEIGSTGIMEPRGYGFRCQKLNFGGNFTYEYMGKCLALKDGVGTMYFKKGL